VGSPVLYTSTSAALAVLEFLVHVDPDDLPPMVLVTYRIPDEKVTAYAGTLPENWRSYPAPARLHEIGRQWLESKTSLALQVPSVLFPEGPEANVLINPLHPAIADLTVLKQAPFAFDTRLFRK
jgi:RES domain-containing protein